jgi:hypothetical protein
MRRILLVYSDSDVPFKLRTAFRLGGWEVKESSHGPGILDFVRNSEPEAIVLGLAETSPDFARALWHAIATAITPISVGLIAVDQKTWDCLLQAYVDEGGDNVVVSDSEVHLRIGRGNVHLRRMFWK